MKIRVSINIDVGRLVKFFVFSDLFFAGGWGLVDPVFSVFIVAKIPGATLTEVGIATAIYWICRSILQIPISNYLDRTPGEKDDFMALIIGLILAGVSAIAFCFTKTIWEVYIAQAVHALGFALYFASWPTIFSRHLDKNRISFDWAFDSVATGVAAGVTGLLGGILAATIGYNAVFIFAGVLCFIASFVLMAVPDIILPKPLRTPAPILERKDEEAVL